MEYIIAFSDIPGELWRVMSRHASSDKALAAKGADGEFIVQTNDDGTSVALWRWDGKRWAKADLE